MRKRIIPKKHLGQHFLADPNVKRQILQACQLSSEDIILEIGPGPGALTKEMIEMVSHVYAIEIDAELCARLHNAYPNSRLTMIHSDFLTCPLDFLPEGVKVVGNLPYNISSPIIERFIEHRSIFQQLFFTVQLEFGKRLAAKADCRDYGSLTCFVQYYSDVKFLFKVKNTAFRPIPQVTSCFVQMTLREPPHKAQNEDLLFEITRHAFQQRRKKIGNALETLFPADQINNGLRDLGIHPNARAENLTLKNYVDLSNVLIAKS